VRFLMSRYLDEAAEVDPAEDPGAAGSAVAVRIGPFELREFLPLGRGLTGGRVRRDATPGFRPGAGSCLRACPVIRTVSSQNP
jgi:hypothetical protein